MTTNQVGERAGGSQLDEARVCRARAEEFARLRQHELHLALRHEAAGRGEASVAATLQALTVYGWRVLLDRQWPRSAGNVDLILVGPGGVVVVDAKTWSEPRVEGGRLYRGENDETDGLDALTSSVAPVVAEVLAQAGYAPTGVLVAAVLAGRSLAPTQVSGGLVMGESEVATWIRHRGHRVDAPDVGLLADLLDEAFPPHRAGGRRVSTTTLAPPHPREKPAAESATLFDVDELAEADRSAAAAGPVERWMTWLHPDQAPLVGRTMNGPARLSGSAGTGKTVVALHRAALAAQLPGARVLVTTYVRTLPVVLGALVARLAPEHTDRIEARSLHSFALALLRSRGVRHRLDAEAADNAFGEAWWRVGRPSALGRMAVIPPYWREEIDVVIKGRGIDRFEDYAVLDRVGRRTPLRLEHRQAVWDLFCAYQDLLRRVERHDFADVLRLARDELRAHPLEQAYTAVIVEEVQDLTMVGVQLLHALVGDATDGLLLVGDSTQALYPGGFRLREAGINVVGRSMRLGTNYRNAAAILEHVHRLRATAVDLDDEPAGVEPTTTGPADTEPTTTETVAVSRAGGQVHVVDAPNEAALETQLAQHLRRAVTAGASLGDCAVLTSTNAAAVRWHRLLGTHGLPSLDLHDYRGVSVDAVKVGTVHRAKGLEFAHVVVPDAVTLPPRQSGESNEAYDERSEVWRRQIHVAMTRARDTLWCGRVVGARSSRSSDARL